MDDSEYAYIRCLFCQSGNEKNVIKHITDSGLGLALSPQKIEPFYRNGAWRDVQKPLLPGYVFLYSQEAYQMRSLLSLPGVIRLLTYGSEDQTGHLTGRDRRFALWLLKNEGVVNKLKAIQEGSYVRIVDGMLKDYNGRVEKVNKRQRTAYLSLEMVGSIHHIWLGLEYVEETGRDIATDEQDFQQKQ